jgi:membrane-bound serine protease (ClpP class)
MRAAGGNFLRLLVLLGIIFTGISLGKAQPTTAPTQPSAKKIRILKIQGMIGPTMAEYVVANLEEIHRGAYACVVLEIDTPGGLDDSMRTIVKAILQSDVPVIAYVWPEGARAASAGTFIVYASHVAAMGPATNIGAAHPVGIQGQTVEDKITNDAVAYLKALAQRRGRNVEWAEKAVRKSDSISASEALKLNVIDLIAKSPTDLLAKLDGREVEVAGRPMVLQTLAGEVEYQKPSWVQNLFQVLGDPTVAYVLLIIGIWGIYFELANPGIIVPGAVGVISLILGLLALSVLPVNLAGLMLIVLAVVLFVADLFTPTNGILTGGGVIAFILGSFLLFPASPYGKVPWPLIIVATMTTTLFFVLILFLVLRAQRSRVIMGTEKLAGMPGVAQSQLDPHGVVLVGGEQWSAESVAGTIMDGEKIIVESIDGLTLKVRRAEPENRH